MDSKASLVVPSTHRTPRSAIAFGVLIVGLAVLYLFVAFLYGHGWSDVAGGLVGVVVIVAGIAFFTFMAWWWTRGWSRPQ